MSTFSELFESYLSQRNASVAGLGKYCQYDRANVYKILHGKRSAPDLEFVERAASYLRLSPSERNAFIEAYHITEIGEGVYLRRKAIRDFLLHFPERIGACSLNEKELPEELRMQADRTFHGDYTQPAFDTYVLADSHAVNTAAYDIVTEVFRHKHGQIRLLLQPDYDFLFNLLATMSPENCHVQVEHIVCMDTSGQEDEASTICLQLIRDLLCIIPLYQNDLQYRSYYFYDSVRSHFKSLNGLCCMILTENAALLCTHDYQKGLVLYSPEAVSLLHRIFDEYKESCISYFLPVSSLSNISTALETIQPVPGDAYLFQGEPCLNAYMDEDLIRAHMGAMVPGPENYASRLAGHMKTQYLAASRENFHRYYSAEGLMHFLETGALSELPRWLYTPFTQPERVRLLSRLRDHCRSGGGCLRLLKPPLSKVSLQLHLYVHGAGGYLLFPGRGGATVCLLIREPALLEAFLDYLGELGDQDLYTPEESMTMLEDLLKGSK